jgi:hypothetical protein
VFVSPGGNAKFVPAEGDVRFKAFVAITLTSLLMWSVLLLIYFSVRSHLLENRGRKESSGVSAWGNHVPSPRGRGNSSGRSEAPKFSVPVRFEPNVGQADSSAEFVGRGGGTTVLLTHTGIEFAGASRSGTSGHASRVAVKFFSARLGRALSGEGVKWRGVARLGGETNYFLGNDPERWRTHVPQFGGAAARNVVPGVDVVAYGGEERLEYDLRVAPGTSAAELRLAISGADGVRVDASGDLVMTEGGRELRMRKPVMYEEMRARLSRPASGAETQRLRRVQTVGVRTSRKIVDGGYVLDADGSVGFRVGAHDRAATLVIDPSLSVGYATFLGGR